MWLTSNEWHRLEQSIRFISLQGESVPDPWYTGDFEETYRRVLAGCQEWLERLEDLVSDWLLKGLTG